jgi:F0F1-type ATP synthase membrane subunit b/b'
MITFREFIRAGGVVLAIVALTMLGQWLSEVSPQFLATFRFVNGFIVLFTLVVLLFKWDTVQKDLRSHRSEITEIFTRIEAAQAADLEKRQQAVEELAMKAAEIAAQVAQHSEEASRKRHEELPARLAEAIEKREAEKRDNGHDR